MTARIQPTYCASLVAVHSPDDGGWYCEFWRHLDDAKRTVIDSLPLDGIHQGAHEALAEGRGYAKRQGLRVFWTTISEGDR